MTTEKLYFQDSHRSVFDAQVLSCEPWKDGWRIVLDRTVFFPEAAASMLIRASWEKWKWWMFTRRTV